jgi:hypothetical protein
VRLLAAPSDATAATGDARTATAEAPRQNTRIWTRGDGAGAREETATPAAALTTRKTTAAANRGAAQWSGRYCRDGTAAASSTPRSRWRRCKGNTQSKSHCSH